MNQFFLEINKVEKAPNYPLHDLRLFVIEEKYCKPQISLLVGLNKLLYYLNLTGGIIILAKPLTSEITKKKSLFLFIENPIQA